MALEVNIRKKLGNFTLDAEFSAENEVFALLGASGCGKSLTLKCIAGIERPDEGRIALDGKILFDSEKNINMTPQERHVGYMFQDYALFPNMTVRKNIMAGMGRKPDIRLVEEYLRKFRIEELADYYPSQLSGGQKQRTAMARIVAQRPEAVLLDEPFSALDSHLKWQLEGEMQQILKEMDRPVIFVSHSRDEVYHLSSRICCMNKGRTEKPAMRKDFFRNPGTLTGALLSGCKNVSAARILDRHHLEAADWGVIFSVERDIPDDTAYVGIRAHYIHEAPEEGCDNILTPVSSAISEDPFEWTVFLTLSEGLSPVQWKTVKTEGVPLLLPEKYYVKSSDLMLLTD